MLAIPFSKDTVLTDGINSYLCKLALKLVFKKI